MDAITRDPLNLVIAGVGGQGNVLISLLLGQAFIAEGYLVTIGETYGASQRAGSVMSHMRISRETQYSPFVPLGRADVVLGMEPVETLRILQQFGNPDVVTIANPRLVYAAGSEPPDRDEVIAAIRKLSAKLWLVNATDEAVSLGDPIFTNVILLGALIGSEILPLDRKSLEPVLKERFPWEKFETNWKAFNRGVELASQG